MGMAASQARYLSLIAKQSNLEYQGQQINQERSVLSQQVTDLYNSLLKVDVPTPPSTNEFMNIEYKGNDGATAFTIGAVKPSGDLYTVEMKKKMSGSALNKEYDKYTVTRDEDGVLIDIGGNEVLTWEDAVQKYGTDVMEKYETALVNTFGENEDSLTTADFYVFEDNSDGVSKICFAEISDVKGWDNYTEFYTFGTGTFTKSETIEYCNLAFDTTGRITSIEIPVSYNPDGTPAKYQKLELEAVQTTDEKAYQDAYAEYEYKKFKYDREQAEINAKTEVIQQQDRNLELKLQRLDNERTQITTEIEALEKVIDDNIEKSYKTFSG